MSSKSLRWTWFVSLVAVTGVALVLAFVLSLATRGGTFYEKHFVWLFWVNAAVAALLLLVLVSAAVRLAVRLQRGKFGTRLLIKLAGIFALVGLLPGVLMRNAGLNFVCRDVHLRVERADTPFTAHYGVGQVIRVPVAHHDGNYFADDATLRTSDDLRLALRLLRKGLGHGAVVVDESTQQITLPDGERIDLGARQVLWRIFAALLAARRERPPRPLDVHALLRAGWPGESPTGASGLNRVKVSLSTLRKLGLRSLLLRVEEGYLLDPDVPLR